MHMHTLIYHMTALICITRRHDLAHVMIYGTPFMIDHTPVLIYHTYTFLIYHTFTQIAHVPVLIYQAFITCPSWFTILPS